MRQWESRCADLRDLVSGHEARCKEAAAEVMKGNDIIEKLQVCHTIVAEGGINDAKPRACVLEQAQPLLRSHVCKHWDSRGEIPG